MGDSLKCTTCAEKWVIFVVAALAGLFVFGCLIYNVKEETSVENTPDMSGVWFKIVFSVPFFFVPLLSVVVDLFMMWFRVCKPTLWLS